MTGFTGIGLRLFEEQRFRTRAEFSRLKLDELAKRLQKARHASNFSHLTMAVFYGLYVADERMAAAFDLIRFFGEPFFVRRAHITVRGPYKDRLPRGIERQWQERRYKNPISGRRLVFLCIAKHSIS